MTTRADIVTFARTLIGTPWRHQGRVPGLALDCVGVLVVTGQHFGIMTFDVEGYERHPDPTTFMHAFESNGIAVALEAAQAGDALVLRDGIYPMHCGILGSADTGLTLIHAYAARRRVVEERLEGEWLLKRIAAFAYPGLT